MKQFLLAVTALFTLFLSADSQAKPDRTTLKTHTIDVSSQSIDFDRVNPENKTFGRLKWRGGLVLDSNAREFGGYSGLAVTDKGNSFIAVSDQGTWITSKLTYKNGQLNGFTNARVGALKSRSGKNLRRKKYADAEDMALWKKNGVTYALISFERKHRIGRFTINKDGISKPSNYLRLPNGVFKTSRNKGLEAVTILKDKKNRGTVLTFLERRHDKNGDHKGWLIRGNKSWPIRLERWDDYDVSGLTTLPNGNVLVLERHFSMFSGVKMRIREIKKRDIKKRAVLEGEILITATMRYNIDNMEGITAHTNKKGETIVTLISDDNFNDSGLQRTLLLQFKLD